MRVGTRKSKLAHEQVRMFSSRLKEEIEIVDVSTEGDSNRNISINEFGSQGVFVNALNRKVLDGEVDCAVHSAKDLPSEIDPDLSITALFDWENFHDIFIGVDRDDAVVGTSAPRRVSQIAYYGKKWIARDIRVLCSSVINHFLRIEERGEHIVGPVHLYPRFVIGFQLSFNPFCKPYC